MRHTADQVQTCLSQAKELKSHFSESNLKSNLQQQVFWVR